MDKLLRTENGYKFAEDINLEDADAVILELQEYNTLEQKILEL